MKLIEKIHNDIYTMGEREYAMAQRVVDRKPDDSVDVLKSIGITSSPKVAKHIEASQQMVINRMFSNQYLEAINRFRYHRIISYKGIMEICERYRLYFGKTSDFIGDVPDSNVRDIRNFIKAYSLNQSLISHKFSVIAPLTMFRKQIEFARFRDPVIVFDAGKQLYAVVTAWGDERDIPDIQKESVN